MVTEKYREATEALALEFYKTYFTNDEDTIHFIDYYLIWNRDRWTAWPININQSSYFFSIDDAYTALKLWVSYDTLIEWYDKSYEAYNRWDTFMNLYNYNIYALDPLKYEEDEKNKIEKAKKDVVDATYGLDDVLWLPRWTSYEAINKE